MMFIDLVGHRYDRLSVMGLAPKDNGRVMWLCRCDCGADKVVSGGNLRSGQVKSCGCLHRETMSLMARHGHARSGQISPEHSVWSGIIARCGNMEDSRYGGRGIIVCERWVTFENFYADMGKRPSAGHTIDRWPDNDGPYSPENCRWATAEQQARNRRSNRIVEFRGKEMPLIDAAELVGLPYKAVWARVVTLGWPLERALSEPVILGRNQYD